MFFGIAFWSNFRKTSVFWSNFRKIGSRIQKFNFSFFFKISRFFRFFYLRALVTTWIICSTLQNINSSIRLAVNSLWKRLLCTQPSKNLDRKGSLECPYAKTTLLRPELLFNGKQLLWWRSKVEVYHFRETSKITKKLSKITIFWKILDFVTSDISARYNTLPCGWSNCTTQKLKQFQKIASGYDFSQKVAFCPPPPQTCKIISHKHIWRM